MSKKVPQCFPTSIVAPLSKISFGTDDLMTLCCLAVQPNLPAISAYSSALSVTYMGPETDCLILVEIFFDARVRVAFSSG
jgi:hypothetical protein